MGQDGEGGVVGVGWGWMLIEIKSVIVCEFKGSRGGSGVCGHMVQRKGPLF